MGLRIKTNVESVIAQNRLSENRKTLTDSLEKMSSGQRINKSADDAAGLAISESIRAKTKALGVAKRNASDGISYLQIAEGGLNEVTNIVVRMRELTAQAATDTIGNRERQYIDKEFQELRQEVYRIIDSTEFNGSKIIKLDGDMESKKIFVGASNRGKDALGNVPDIDPENDSDVLTIDVSDVARLAESINDIAAKTRDDRALALVPEDLETGGAQDLGPTGTADILTKLDTALNSIADYRGTLGSVGSRLQSTMANVDVSTENLLAAQSRIRDVDYASETAKFTQGRILTQAGAAVLMQANSQAELALTLLRG
jgi:flagellin